MDDKLAATISAASDQVLVDVVKLAQKYGMKGNKGGWKDFLNAYDKMFGSCLSDPTRRPRETLVSFLQTFTEEEHLKFVANFLRARLNREVLKQMVKESLDNESPEQRLVRSTLEHPFYLSKYTFPSYEQEWVVTKIPKKSKWMSSNRILAVDCEMVLCEDGTDALVRVCVVDCNLQVKLDELVNPSKAVADYRTEITGVSAGDLNGVSSTLADIQKSMKKLLSKGTILVGHGLHNDLQALKIDHARVVDTSFIFKTSDGYTPSLRNLCKSVLGYELRKDGAPHNCLDDARAAMKIILAKVEHGVDNDIPLIQDVKDVPEAEMAKLLLHRIPPTVNSKELRRIFPRNFTVELKPHKKAEGVQYSMLASFKDPQEAHHAFEILNGNVNKDTAGRPQKLVKFQLSTGVTITLYVRKMGNYCTRDKVYLKKRAFEGKESGDVKKLKTNESGNHSEEVGILEQELEQESNHSHDDLQENERLKQELIQKELELSKKHLEEIERLKQDIKNKDFQIMMQDKIINDLKKRLEEQKKSRKKGY